MTDSSTPLMTKSLSDSTVPKIVIGLHGPAGSGKSFFASVIEDEALRQHLAIRRMPFAGPLKRVASSMGWNGKKDGKGRRLLQLIGTECGRKCISEDLWVDKWRRELDDTQANCVIVDDVRFPNELSALKAVGGYAVKLKDARSLAWRLRATFGLLHKSEVPLPDAGFDDVIFNEKKGNGFMSLVAFEIIHKMRGR